MMLKIKSTCVECFMKINVYLFQELLNRHLFFGHTNVNSMKGRYLCQQSYLQWPLPERQPFLSIYHHFREAANWGKNKRPF
jgi:hypothetical protein